MDAREHELWWMAGHAEKRAFALAEAAEAYEGVAHHVRQGARLGIPITDIARAARISRPTVYRIIREGEQP